LGDSHASRAGAARSAADWWWAGVAYDIAELRGNRELGIYQRQVLIRLRVGNQAGYRTAAANVAQLLATEKLPFQSALAAVRILTLGADAVPDWRMPLALTANLVGAMGTLDRTSLPEQEKALLRHHVLQCRAGVLLRAGQFQEALACLNRMVKDGQGMTTVEEWLLLALVQQRLGNLREARNGLAKARAGLDASLPNMDWQDRLRVQLLHAEATRLLSD
jgi:hypothetical protein